MQAESPEVREGIREIAEQMSESGKKLNVFGLCFPSGVIINEWPDLDLIKWVRDMEKAWALDMPIFMCMLDVKHQNLQKVVLLDRDKEVLAEHQVIS